MLKAILFNILTASFLMINSTAFAKINEPSLEIVRCSNFDRAGDVVVSSYNTVPGDSVSVEVCYSAGARNIKLSVGNKEYQFTLSLGDYLGARERFEYQFRDDGDLFLITLGYEGSNINYDYFLYDIETEEVVETGTFPRLPRIMDIVDYEAPYLFHDEGCKNYNDNIMQSSGVDVNLISIDIDVCIEQGFYVIDIELDGSVYQYKVDVESYPEAVLRFDFQRYKNGDVLLVAFGSIDPKSYHQYIIFVFGDDIPVEKGGYRGFPYLDKVAPDMEEVLERIN